MNEWYDETFPELRPAPPWVMEEMIASTPDLVAGVLQAPGGAAIAGAIAQTVAAGEPVVTTGCGTSLHAAEAVAELIEDALARSGDPARVEARDAFEAALAPRRGGMLIAVSHDGATRATTLALEGAAAAGATTALITHRPDGSCAASAELLFVTPVADLSWCHTIAYSSAILAGAAIAEEIAPSGTGAEAVRERITGLHASVAGPCETAAALLGPAARVVIAGSGCDRTTSRELALKLEEGPHLPAAHRDLEILLHGHLVACEPGTPIVVVALDPRGRPRRLDRALGLLDAADALGTPVVLAADEAAAAAGGTHASVHTCIDGGAAALPQPLDALLAGSAILQLLTLATVHERGTNPDLIRREQAPWREAAQVLERPNW